LLDKVLFVVVECADRGGRRGVGLLAADRRVVRADAGGGVVVAGVGVGVLLDEDDI